MNTAIAIAVIMLCGAQIYLRVHYIFGSLSDAFVVYFFPSGKLQSFPMYAATWWWRSVRGGWSKGNRKRWSVGQTCVVIISIFILFCSIFTPALLPYYVNAQHWNFNYTTAKIHRIQMKTRKLITLLPFHFQPFFTLFMTKEYKRKKTAKTTTTRTTPTPKITKHDHEQMANDW